MIDDKTNLPSLLKDFPEYAPVYHYLIYDSEMIDLSDSRGDTGPYDPRKLLSLLGVSEKLIIKPLGESGGEGVFRIEANAGSFSVNGNGCNERDLLRHLTNLERHIVCQFEQQHQYASDLYPLGNKHHQVHHHA